jgi:hypothetical protein
VLTIAALRAYLQLLLLLLLLATTFLQVLSGAGVSGPERRATIPLCRNVAAGDNNRMDVVTASAAIDTGSMDGALTAQHAPSVQV